MLFFHEEMQPGQYSLYQKSFQSKPERLVEVAAAPVEPVKLTDISEETGVWLVGITVSFVAEPCFASEMLAGEDRVERGGMEGRLEVGEKRGFPMVSRCGERNNKSAILNSKAFKWNEMTKHLYR